MVVASAAQEADSSVGPLIEGQDRADVIGELQLGQSRRDPQRRLEPKLGRDQVEELFETVEPDRPSMSRVSSGVFAI